MNDGPRQTLFVALLLCLVFVPVRLDTQAAPDTLVLRGPTVGAVKFPHVAHVDRAECVACHHESRPELPATSDYPRCQTCHTETVEPPLVTNARDAFHDRRARQGLCVDCHATEATNGTKTPTRCSDCHKQDQT